MQEIICIILLLALQAWQSFAYSVCWLDQALQ
jgi:hypothetical protein